MDLNNIIDQYMIFQLLNYISKYIPSLAHVRTKFTLNFFVKGVLLNRYHNYISVKSLVNKKDVL
jgi:hypothetical protein